MSTTRATFLGWLLELTYAGDAVGVFPTLRKAIEFAHRIDNTRGIIPARRWFVNANYVQPVSSHRIVAEMEEGGDEAHIIWVRSVLPKPEQVVKEMYARHPYLKRLDQRARA